MTLFTHLMNPNNNRIYNTESKGKIAQIPDPTY